MNTKFIITFMNKSQIALYSVRRILLEVFESKKEVELCQKPISDLVRI
jgi:hypothetical protein